MDRRRFLATAGSGTPIFLAGCTSIGSSPTNPSEDESFQRRSVSVNSTGEMPDTVSASLSVEATSSRATPDQTITFRFTLTNEADTVQQFDVGSIPVPNLLVVQSDPPNYVLLQPSSWTADDRRSDCWENTDPDNDPYRVVPEENQVELEPSKSYSGDAALWGSVEDDVCWPEGEFTFENSVTFGETTFTWGFQFEVTKQ
ncbi:hypothetical protein [Saliphagus infecundisoli]|uniref:Lipoprotein n=1 Tax=Saliphagus infecundisoli TaxID=1849069 RepID=A0ABD5QL66_9EURY|nr:hypothetical protein [Saliphagus infecundisoli]